MTEESIKRRKLIGSVRKCSFSDCDKVEVCEGRWKEHWHPYNDGYLCKNHYSKLVGYKKRTAETRKKYNDKYNIRKIKFIDRQIIVDKNPKTGYCSWCSNNVFDGSCKVTNMHHVEYDDKDILANTIELCASCHAKETVRLKPRKDRSTWFCLICDSKTTYFNKNTIKWMWFKYQDGHICNKCYNKIKREK